MSSALLPRVALALLPAACAASAACVADAPIAHRADMRASYASKYFRVDAPPGMGWEASVASAEHPFEHERALFTPWVPPRIGFALHGWRELWPHSTGAGPTIELGAVPAAAAREESPSAPPGMTFRGERELGGLRWRVHEDARTPALRSALLTARDAGIDFSVRMRVPESAREVPPPELARVVAGFHREPVSEAAETLAIERGVAALHRLASDGGWTGGRWDPALEGDARTGIAVLSRVLPARGEGPLFAAALELLRGRNEFLARTGGTAEPVGPFEVALQGPQGHIATTALSGPYDAVEAVRLLREATARAPDSFWARYHLGAALARSGDARGAASELTSLARRTPESALAWFTLALVQRDAGDRDAARASARRAAAANAKREVFARYGTGLFGSTLVDALEKELRR